MNKRDSSWFFTYELDGTPHSSSKHHSSINSKFVLSFDCNLNKLFEIMMPSKGDKIRPRLTVKAGNKTFSWLFDTGAAVTCMNRQSFDLAFAHNRP